MTVLDFAREIIQIIGADSEIAFQELPVNDPKVRQPDISLARDLLDWEPKIVLEDGLADTIEYFRTHR
jgi:dTDP-glucose 4,6-dehydratase